MKRATFDGGWTLEWSSAAQALEGVSGDAMVVACSNAGALVAAIDGLGHGPEAAEVAQAAANLIEKHAHESVDALIERCHQELRGTRGVVLSVASFRAAESTLTWCGVGNVEAVLLGTGEDARPRRHEAIVTRGGVVGYQLPALRSRELRVRSGDTLVMATDGIGSRFLEYIDDAAECPDDLARTILVRDGRGCDDALVVVARFLGAPS